MTDLLTKENAYLKVNRETLASHYPGKYVLIKGEEVYGAFETRAVSTPVRQPDSVFTVATPRC